MPFGEGLHARGPSHHACTHTPRLYLLPRANARTPVPHRSGCVTGDKELDISNVSVAVVGAGQPFEEVVGPRLQAFLDAIEVR
jgi:hypothetical protein